MAANTDEIKRRESAARTAIERAFGTPAGEDSIDCFIEHHLEELDGAYWRAHAGVDQPDGARVLAMLQLKSHWSSDTEDGMDVFDFTLPGDVTAYVVSVRFDAKGDVSDVSMES
ncbi:DUF2004 domain-containing protein [Massilia sp. S19_KUP03_FR1]|uniref:DUF2004 domain-containing protein n=1 Tax=Massilia sp. S19_KUP03_FR1 TaxID=3025503 RepID=UPI002FCD0EC3